MKLFYLFTIILLSACASTAPTVETYTSYRIYDVSSEYSLIQVKNAVLNAAKATNNNATVVNNIPPMPLPQKPGRFAIKDMQFGVYSFQSPQTPGATISISSSNRPSDAENMNWVIGVYPYELGYSVQVVMTATYRRGTANLFDPVELGASLGRELAFKQQGGVEQHIQSWFDSLSDKVEEKIHLKLVELYPTPENGGHDGK